MTIGVGALRSDAVAAAATETFGAGYTALAPSRVLDSRAATGGWNGPLGASSPRQLAITGAGKAVPADAVAVVLNVTVTEATAGSYLSVYPAGTATPTASNINFEPRSTVANLVVAKLGANGGVAFFNGYGSVHVVADLVGYFAATSTSRYNATSPTRVLDTRTGTGFAGALTAGTDRTLALGNTDLVPSTATAVAVNLTVTGPSAGSYVTLYPHGDAVPPSSSINFGAGQTVANLAIAKLGADRSLSFHTHAGAVHVVVDLVGYFDASHGDRFVPLAPTRHLDSREPSLGWTGRLQAGSHRSLHLRGHHGIGTGASAVIANATITASSDDSYLTVYPAAGAGSDTSTVNFRRGTTVANLTIARVGFGGQAAFAVGHGSTHVVFDVVGYFASSSTPPPDPGGPVTFTRTVIDANPPSPLVAKAFGDLDNDGRPDAVVGLQSPAAGIVWYRAPASGNPSDPWTKHVVTATGSVYEDLALVDVDGDGWRDVIASVDSAVYWYRNPATLGGTWTPTLIGPGYGENNLAIADIDGDGRFDVVTPLNVFFQNSPTSWTSRAIGASFRGTALLAVGGLGAVNLVTTGPGPGYEVVWYENPRERGGSARTDEWVRHVVGPGYQCASAGTPTSQCTEWQMAVYATGDINGDGRVDIVSAQAEVGLNQPAAPGGIRWFEAPADRSQPWAMHDVDAGFETVNNLRLVDIDGDGRLDVVAGEGDQSPLKRIAVLYNLATGFAPSVLSTEGSHTVAIADLSGDGDTDLLVSRHGFFGGMGPLTVFVNNRFGPH
ncbi:MAG: FG-GAP repeat domain-containing protein [Acidimicrobiia bacterium]